MIAFQLPVNRPRTQLTYRTTEERILLVYDPPRADGCPIGLCSHQSMCLVRLVVRKAVLEYVVVSIIKQF